MNGKEPVDTPRQKLLAKIKALLAKTVANGCTEAEALSALETAHRLMTDYDVTDNDLSFAGETARVNTEPKDDSDDIGGRMFAAVGAFCGCRSFKNGIERIAFVGLYSETVFAHWLLDTLVLFVERACKTFLDNNPSRYRVRRLESRGFKWGCADRLAQRLYALAALRPTGNAMTVKKNDLIKSAMDAAGIRLRDSRFTLRRYNAAAERAGVQAANEATFDKAVTEADTPKAIP